MVAGARPLIRFLLLLLLPTAAVAQTPAPVLLPGIGAADPRHPVDPAEAPWRGLGRVQLEIGGTCTGALIAPRLVLTAAHCLVAPRSRSLVRPGTVHFLLGYDRGRAVAHARVTAYRTGPGFRANPPGPPASDWAVLTLDAPVGGPDRVLPLLPRAPAARTPLMLGGYQQDRREVLMADTGCRAVGLLGRGEGRPLLAHDCASTRGTSGAPVLAQGPDGRWGIAGIASFVRGAVAMGYAVPATAVEPPPE